MAGRATRWRAISQDPGRDYKERQGGVAQPGTMSHETGDGARCRVRTGRTSTEHQALAEAYSPYCAPGAEKGLGADLDEVIAAWPLLADPLKAAVLGIVRSIGTGLRAVGKEGK